MLAYINRQVVDHISVIVCKKVTIDLNSFSFLRYQQKDKMLDTVSMRVMALPLILFTHYSHTDMQRLS